MKFIKKPISLPSNYRFFYQISVLLLILEFCGSKNTGVSTLKFQLLLWALRDDDGYSSLMKVTRLKEKKNNFTFWALDPALNRAIEFALADGFLILHNEKFVSGSKGDALLIYILDNDLFSNERKILMEFGKSVTEAFVTSVLKNENA